jgi:hypothetical protein
MNIEYILNDALNKAMCQKGRIQNPNSNKVAEFVSKYIKAEKLILTDVVVPKGTLPKCEHKHIIGGDGCFECADCGA